MITASIVVYKNNSEKISSICQTLVQARLGIKIFIIDNSTDSLEGGSFSSPEITYIRSKKNIGYGKGHNLALRKALKSKAKYHMVLNPDVSFSPETVYELYRYMESNPDVGNVMPRVNYPEGNNQYLAKCLPAPLDLWVRLFHRFLPNGLVRKINDKYELHFLPLDQPVEVPSLSGCFMFLRCDALRKAGCFDDRYFLYFEDFDLVRRIGEHYRIIYYPMAEITHQFQRASRKNPFAFGYHVASAIKYFNKWGWFNDRKRQEANAKLMKQHIKDKFGSPDLPSFDRIGLKPKRKINSIAIISNQAFSLFNFRYKMMEDMVSRGIRVYALAPDYQDNLKEKALDLGVLPVNYKLDRTGRNPFRDLTSIMELAGILSKLKLDAVLLNFIKPVIYGSWAAKRAGIDNIYSMISGLGYVYTQSPCRDSLKTPVFRGGVTFLYKKALSLNKKVFFQNPDDFEYFVSHGLVDLDKSVRIYGSGVDIKYFSESSVSSIAPVSFVLTARLLLEKGIREYFQAACLVKERYDNVNFFLLGGFDINPAGISSDELKQWLKSDIVDFPGQVQDVRPWLRKASVFVLPSWREGTPRSTLEAMACGKAIITTDVPGCRETVFPDPETGKFTYLEGGKLKAGINGIMVPVRDPNALAQAMEYMINNPDKVVEMGRQSRLLAEKYYDVRKVNRVIFKEMGI